jgi:putative tricarboxylic transport membrane protein
MLVSDRVSGAVLVALGGLSFYGGSLLPPVPGQQIGPAVFPMVVGGGIAICGALIMLGIGQSFEAEAEADVQKHSAGIKSEPPLSQTTSIALTVLPPALLLFYYFASERLGFVLTGLIMVLVAARAFGAPWRLALPLAVLSPLAVHFAFLKLLRVPLPPGPLPLPW